MAIRKPIGFAGGKDRLADKIIEHFPDRPEIYIEPFCGSAAIFFAAPGSWSDKEILNDINGNLIAFFRSLRDHEREFIRRIQLTPYSRGLFYETKARLLKGKYKRELEQGVDFYIMVAQSFGASGRGWMGARDRDYLTEWLSRTAPPLLARVAARLRHAVIENADAVTILERYDCPGALFYLDPPYLGIRVTEEDQKSNNLLDMTEEDHARLIAACLKLKGRCLISGYQSAVYSPLVKAGWKLERFAHINSLNNRDAHQARGPVTECLWINPALLKSVKMPTLF